MKRASLLLLALALLIPFAAARGEVNPSNFTLEGCIGVYSISSETVVRQYSTRTGSPVGLGSDEYLSFVVLVTNNGPTLTCGNLYARIDGGEPLAWSGDTLEQGVGTVCHIFYSNMRNVAPGLHTLDMYCNDTFLGGLKYTLLRDWSQVMDLPEDSEIAACTTDRRSPFIALYPDLSGLGGFREYSVDFCGQYQPGGTYLCIGSWDMDHSDLESRYSDVHIEDYGSAGYAGFQVLPDGTHCAILSLWDTCYTDSAGEHTLRATRTYPAQSLTGDSFEGEGVGAHCLVPYDWQSGRWYRALLQCATSQTSGNTLVSLWVRDLETERWTRLIEYDTGLRNSCFRDSMIPFLENFEPGTAGELRSMELANMRARLAPSGQWVDPGKRLLLPKLRLPRQLQLRQRRP